MEQEKNPQSQATENNKNQKNQQDQKSKRERKTIEQELAELEAKKQKILNKKRKEETQQKILFGVTIIDLLKEFKAKNDQENFKGLSQTILKCSKKFKEKDQEIIKNVISKISENS